MAALEIRLVGEERIENYANYKCGTRSEQKKKKVEGEKKNRGKKVWEMKCWQKFVREK